MKVWTSILQARQDIAHSKTGTVVTIGNFDGVHRGHQAIMGRTVELAREKGVWGVAVTFANHTESVLGERPLLINQPAIRRELIARQGLDALLEVEFTPNLASLEPAVFFDTWLIEGLNAQGLVVGYDFRFGAGSQGDYNYLKSLTSKQGLLLEQILPVKENYQIISSSKVRQLLAEGRLTEANRMLGYCFTIDGEVTSGEQRGRKLGYPTANIHLDPDYLLPCYGVYLVRVWLGGKYFFGIANVGIKPTFGEFQPLVEVYLLDIEVNLYHQLLRVEFLNFIRPENRFSGSEALKAQIARDIEVARGMLDKYFLE